MSPPPVFEVFYDGECPLCMREVRMLQRLDKRRHILFADISSADFDASSVGVTWSTLMARIHGRMPDGTLVEGVEVFRQLYAAVGFGLVVAISRLPGISHVLEAVYRVFARNRLRLTGRCADDLQCSAATSPNAR